MAALSEWEMLQPKIFKKSYENSDWTYVTEFINLVTPFLYPVLLI